MIKENSMEEKLLQRAVEKFGYKSPTEFICKAIPLLYQVEVDSQLEMAAIYRNENTDPIVESELQKLQLGEEIDAQMGYMAAKAR